MLDEGARGFGFTGMAPRGGTGSSAAVGVERSDETGVTLFGRFSCYYIYIYIHTHKYTITGEVFFFFLGLRSGSLEGGGWVGWLVDWLVGGWVGGWVGWLVASLASPASLGRPGRGWQLGVDYRPGLILLRVVLVVLGVI